MAKIRTVELADGTKRYRFTADVGRHPDGKRRQQTMTFKRRKDAELELARIGYQRPRGEYVPRWNGTLDELCDAYLRAALRGKEVNTVVSYTAALRLPRQRLGKRRAQSVTRDDIEALVDFALEHGRVRGGKPGTGLGVRSARLMVQQLSACFEQAIDDQKVTRNPCRKVRVDGRPKATRATWSQGDLRQFLAVADADRLGAAWRLTLYGLRRGEVCGLRWDDVDLGARTVTIGRARVVAGPQVIEKSPKSERGYRTLPLDEVLAAALLALHDRQVTEQMEAGPAYEPTGYVVADELGRPVHPEWFSDEFQRVAGTAGVPRIRLHDGRHTVSSLMATAGVPSHIRAAWCGHTVKVNEDTYTHARPEDLALAAAALGKIHNPAA
jgi:integrase